MTNDTVKVVLKLKYQQALNNKLSSKKQNKNKRILDLKEMFNYFSKEEKSTMGMFDYYNGALKDKKINLIKKDGNYANEEELEMLKKRYINYLDNSNLWKGIISFNNDYIDENINIRDLEQKLAKKIFPSFFKYAGFKDIKNMDYVLSFHDDTDNYHFHFAFIEKKANFEYGSGKIDYRLKGNFSIKEQNFLKRLICLEIEREKHYKPKLVKLNNELDDLKTYFNHNDKNYRLNNINNFIIEEKLVRLGYLVNKTNNKQKGRINYKTQLNKEYGKEIKILTKDIKKYLLNDKNSVIKEKNVDIKKTLKEIKDFFLELDKDNNINTQNNNDLTKSKQEYINNYIDNAILQNAYYKVRFQNNKRQDLTLQELIEIIVYDKSIIDDYYDVKKVRINILSNFLRNGTFTNKNKIDKAFKTINEEMQQATEKFSELFDYKK